MEALLPISIIFRIIVLIINATGLWLIFLVLNKKTAKKSIVFYFISMVVFMFLWVNFAFLSRNLSSDLGLTFIRIAWAITPFFFILIFLFIVEFLRQKISNFKPIKVSLLFLGVINVPVVLFFESVIKDVYLKDNILEITYGPLSWLFFFEVIFFTGLSFYSLAKQYFISQSNLEKRKIEHIFIGFTFFFLMNSIFNIILPFFFEIFYLYYLGDYSTIILIIFIAYAVLKSELFGIKVVVNNFLIFLMGIVLLVLPIIMPTVFLRLLTSILFLLFVFFGYYLIKATKEEEKRRISLENILKKEKQLREKAESLNQEFERLDNAKNQFIMATQHHLRTPLTAMIGYIDLLLSGNFGKIPKRMKGVLSKFQASTSRLGRTINEFLDISQFQLGREVISPEENVDILPVLKEMEEEIGIEAKNKGIYFKVEKQKLPLIYADINKIKIAFFNIADNAIKYTSEGGVTIKTKAKENRLQIIFQDTGMGLSKEEKEKLFTTLFERGMQAKKVFATGRGIGLFLSSQIIKAHGGKIWVESEGKKKGSTFYIELPIKKYENKKQNN